MFTYQEACVHLAAQMLTIVKLKPDNLTQMLNLQSKVMAKLIELSQGAFMQEKSPQKYTHLLADEQSYGLGLISTDGILIAQSWSTQFIQKGSITGLLDVPPVRGRLNDAFAQANTVSTIHNVMVTPEQDWRGKRIMPNMISCLVGATAQSTDHAYFAEVAAANTPSANGFLHHGFHTVLELDDPEDGTPLMYVQSKAGKTHTPKVK